MDTPVYSATLKRRSIRRFTDQKVDREQTEILLRAAMAAPSACNLQPWAFVVVDEPETLTKVKDATEQGKYNAPLAIVVCGITRHIPWEGEGWRADCGAAAQNIMLTCTDMGLASVCIGGFDEEVLRRALSIPSDVYPVCIIEIGYPAYTREALTWYDADAVYYQRFDKDRPRRLRTLKMLAEDIEKGII